MEMGTLDVRSPEGHAAHSMQGTDERWVLIQVNTFKNWINDQLSQVDEHVDDLRTDLCDGLKLCRLMEVVLGRRIGRVIKKPLNQHHYLENVNLALRAMTNDGIKLVNIGSEDIVNSNLRLILGLIWRLILKYQISRSKVPPKKLMLSWLHAVIPDLHIGNFNSDWNDGVALNALMEYCKPGTCPNWRQLSRRDGLANCRSAMEQAKEHFGIPMIVSPENLASPDLDELSGMTYLSYFMKMDSPGYHATLRFVQNQVPSKNVQNFQTDWNDGLVLGSLVTSLGGSIQGWPDNVDFQDHEGLIQKSMNSAKMLGVEPVISSHEMADTEVDHLGVMAYAAWFEHLKPRAPVIQPPPPSPPPVIRAPTPPPVRSRPSEQINLVTEQSQTSIGQTVRFKLEAQDSDIKKSEVRVEVVGPSSKPPVTLTWQGMTAYGEFSPQQQGTHKIVVYNEGEVVRGAPADIIVSSGIERVTLVQPIRDTAAGSSQQILISAEDARRGAVRVEAKAPSGRTHEMAIGESNGVYTANFTPTEVGDWLISILYEGTHIQGSPFNVRVYDAAQVKVFGLEGGAVGKMFSFSVDTAGAGEGALKVNISHDGREVPVQVFHEGRGMYRVNFTPDGGGLYTIRVYFAEMEVTGSPYSLEIVDSSMVTAAGEGLSSVEVNRKATFTVTTGHRGSSGDIRVTVKAPRGQQIPCEVINNGDGTHTIEYTASEVGEYNIDVLYYGKPITGSPFRVQAFDWNRISIHNLTQNGTVGKLVEFDIDAQYAGSGNLEIMVNDGTIPCSVQNRGNRQFHASFMPRDPVPHFIQMRFNGREVPGSPWRVDMRSAAHVTVRGAGGGSTQLIPVNRPAAFEVTTGAYDGNVTANITSPTRRMVSSQVINNNNGSYMVQYTPTEVGNYQIEIAYAGQPVPGSPFSSKAYDTSAIVVSPISSGVTGKAVEFTIDVTQAGEGQLEIMVNRGAVPNTVKMLRKGVFLVTFIPREARNHLVDIKFNGELYPRCPLTVAVMDASRVTVQGDGIRQVAVNRSSFFKVNTQSAGNADLSVRVTSPNNDLVPAKIVQQPDGDYKVEYSSMYTGRHTVEILYSGQPIMGSPFYVEIYDPNKIRVEGARTGNVAQLMDFEIIRNEAGKAELGLNITSPSGHPVQYNIVPTRLGDRVTYTPTEPGPYLIYITYGGLEVPGCPITQTIMDGGSIASCYGDGLHKGFEDVTSSFVVDTRNQQGELTVEVEGPNSMAKCHKQPNGQGQYTVTYTPVEVGEFTVHVRWNGRDIEGSPFHPKVVDPRKLRVIGGWENIIDVNNRFMVLQVGQPKRIEFDSSLAGPGVLTAEARGPDGVLPTQVERLGTSHILTFTPRVAGEHSLHLFWGEGVVPRSPLVGVAGGGGIVSNGQAPVNHEKVVLTGRGLKEAVVRQEAEFVIDGMEAGPGAPDVKLTGIKTDIHVQVTPLGEQKYRCVYEPQLPGAYLLNIMWSDRQVRGSPFKVNVVAHSDASKVVCTGDGLKTGILGREIKSLIDTRNAGPGELTAHCMGPSKVAFCELYDHRNGTFQLNVRPQEPGRHVLQIKYGGEHVPGSPYVLKVSGAPDASKVRVSGPGIEHGILATYQSRFICETRGAGAGQLTVRIRGPKGAFRVEMQRESQKDRTILCRYDPTEVGDYIISVKWSGVDVPGSPFHIQIFDTTEELERFMADNPHRRQNAIEFPPRSSGGWADDM